MTDQPNAADAEFSAMQTLYNALEPLDDDARSRVVNYIVARLEIVHNASRAAAAAAEPAAGSEPAAEPEIAEATTYGSVAELYDATQPKTNGDKALIAGYWLQVCQGAENFDSQSANKELKHLGQGLANVTAAIESLKNQKPALALQLKKSGKSQQARKVYKITVAGVKAVEAMING
ncbi:hypothetical protein LB542_16705 [Mesorhizobium sp. BR1-1-9]|uniref:hypothetical protein n=1 Tax=unclassified Mesorhizobium TaxID=325217 RepID=UPI001127D68A|nr:MULTISPECIES: hypothetical protein [unclassified Mesorhizobium]MBZ9807787.1 hypothetical protein [Mesorhizobium sp. ESP-6-2]MBZ9872493.1 hypothetical protein [Mesorhizobium sp. BR1-1-9]MBZ9941885.1 hypothetical protein [Mesorhizobium sp. BR1-1-13]TPM31227.1 hypothetical protein FJ955_09465 [Mesorhizobium sp. B2-2-2]